MWCFTKGAKFKSFLFPAALLLFLFCSFLLCPSFALADVGSVVEKDGIQYTVVSEPENATSYGQVKVSGTTATFASESVELGVVNGGTVAGEANKSQYKVVAVASGAFKGNTTIKTLTFTESLPGIAKAGHAVGESAFEGCTNLQSVAFAEGATTIGGIGSNAFKGCSALENVTFPEGAKIQLPEPFSSLVALPCVGSSAFEGCTSLKTIALPALMDANQKANYYSTFDELNPNTLIGANSTVKFTSGHQAYWHEAFGPCANVGLSDNTFAGCTSLETVVFRAGAARGSFAVLYGNSSTYACFANCPALKNLLFSPAQSYWTNENQALLNNAKVDIWENAQSTPNVYLGVTFYATNNAASVQAASEFGTGRYARLQFATGTSVSSIASGNISTSDVFANSSVYAQSSCALDGNIEAVNPNTAAAAAGLDTSINWAWKLTNAQSQRAKLTDSCSAYLVPANDISAGKLSSSIQTQQQAQNDANLSEWLFDGVQQDSTFDANRFYADANYNSNSCYVDSYFELSGSTQALLDALNPTNALGNKLNSSDYSIAYQAWDAENKKLASAQSLNDIMAEYGESGGPVLVTLTGTGEYTGTLQEWVLVRGGASKVVNRFTNAPAQTTCCTNMSTPGSSSVDMPTWYAATAASAAQGSANVYSENDNHFALSVGTSDLSSALVGVSWAGLTKAAINVQTTTDANFGFGICSQFNAKSGTIDTVLLDENKRLTGSGAWNNSASELSASEFAVQSYEISKMPTGTSIRSRFNFPESEHPWGTTALLLDANSLNSTACAAASYAYACAAPVFYTESDGSISSATQKCLQDFTSVVAMGSKQTFSESAVNALKSAGVAVDSQFTYDVLNARALSIDAANALLNSTNATGVAYASAATVSVCDAANPFDSIGALNRSGFYGGITLVSASVADSKEIASYLYSMNSNISEIYTFGRANSNSLQKGWDLPGNMTTFNASTGYTPPEVQSGDTLELEGALFGVSGSSGNFTLAAKECVWANPKIAAGTYKIGNTSYMLRNAYDGSQKTSNLSGTTATETSAAIAGRAFSQSSCAVLARDDEFADAMSATGLAGVLDAPIVLTSRTELSQAAAETLKALGVKSVYIIGGSGAMPFDFESALESIGISKQNVTRVFGDEFYDTSVECAKQIASIKQQAGQKCDKAIVAFGENFQDALSISSFAYAYGVPIFLQTKGDSASERHLPESATNMLVDSTGAFANAAIFVPGGTGAVSAASAEGVFGSNLRGGMRIGGNDGFDTSNLIAQTFVNAGLLSARTVCIASGAISPGGVDALAGAALAGKAGGVMLLVNGNSAIEATNTCVLDGFLTSSATSVVNAYTLGGEYVMPPAIESSVKSIIGG